MSKYIFFFIIIFTGIIVYSSSIKNDFVWDDNAVVVPYTNILKQAPNKLFVQGFHYRANRAGIFGFTYEPMPFLVYLLTAKTIGLQPAPLHIIQIALTIANAILVFLLFKKFFPEKPALFLALIFLVHPINNEPVIYIATLQATLFLFFGLLAIVSAKSFLIWIFLFLSILSRESGAIFLVLVPLFNFLFNKKNFINSLTIVTSIILLYLPIRAYVAKQPYDVVVETSMMMREPVVNRLSTIPKIFSHYLSIFFFPQNPLVNQHWAIRSINIQDFFLPLSLLFFFLTLLIVIGVLIRKHQQFKAYLFFVFWFFIGLSLYLQIFPLDMTVADRYFYSAGIGLVGIIGVILARIKTNNFVFAVIIFLLSIRTILRIPDWKDTFTLFTHDNAISPSYSLEHGIAYEYLQQKQFEKAITHYRKSLSLFPSAMTWNDLGAAYEKKGDYDSAIASFQNAVKMDEPVFQPYYNLAFVLLKKNPREAKDILHEGLKKFPKEDRLWQLLTVVNNIMEK